MKVEEKIINVTTEGLGASTQFSIKQENMAHIANVLRSSLYSNKPKAILREYACNAYDSHVEAGKENVPIQVTLPTLSSPELRIRDFGKGLSTEDVMNIYASYGESTKRQSNKLIGQLGIGSKAAFCYSPQFSIVSIHNGLKTLYIAFLDESDIGTLSQVGNSIPTKEESGVEIIVKVDLKDISSFSSEAKNFFAHFTPFPVLINGKQIEEGLNNSIPTILRSGPNWSLVTWNSGRPKWVNLLNCRMGNINYDIDLTALSTSENFNSSWLERFVRDYHCISHSALILEAEIGQLQFSASRESLEYNQKTKDFLVKAFNDIFASISDSFNQDVDKASTFWEAIKEAKIAQRELKFITQGIKFTYKGKDLPPWTLLTGHALELKYKSESYNTTWDHTKPWRSLAASLELGGDYKLLAHDTLKLSHAKAGRIAAYLIEQDTSIPYYLLRGTTDNLETFLDKNKETLEGLEIIRLSTVVLPKLPRVKKAQPTQKTPRIKQLYSRFTGYVNSFKDAWEPIKDLPKHFIYIPKDNLVQGNQAQRRKLAELRNLLPILININPEIIALHRSVEVQEHWVSVEELIREIEPLYIEALNTSRLHVDRHQHLESFLYGKSWHLHKQSVGNQVPYPPDFSDLKSILGELPTCPLKDLLQKASNLTFAADNPLKNKEYNNVFRIYPTPSVTSAEEQIEMENLGKEILIELEKYPVILALRLIKDKKEQANLLKYYITEKSNVHKKTTPS